MSNYHHILIGVDFSLETGIVIDRGLELAGSQGAKVSFIHVVEYSGYLFPPDAPFPVELDLEPQFVDKAREHLISMKKSRGRSDSACYVEEGSPTQEIVRVAEQNQVDLIVIGSHGRHGIQRILGSTASGVTHTAGCDVLAVRVGSGRME
ncbi:MAG: universal stress protein [Candidatus Promineifilaceae bacterium]